MSLSPWDLGGNIVFDFTLYRPRRPSYVFATQMTRQRSESYRHATTGADPAPATPPGLPGVTGGTDPEALMVGAAVDSIRKKRKNSYKAATQEDEEEDGDGEAGPRAAAAAGSPVSGDEEEGHRTPFSVGNHVGRMRTRSPDQSLVVCTCSPSSSTGTDRLGNDGGRGRKGSVHTPSPQPRRSRSSAEFDDDEGGGGVLDRRLPIRSSGGGGGSGGGTMSRCRYVKNLVVLSLSFILVFTAFRSIQNVQSSLNSAGRLGVIAMGCVHGTMFLTCLFTPVLINRLTLKWTIVLGLLFYLFWIAANFCPHLFTLVPTSIGVGFGQSLSWGAQVSYVQRLVDEYVRSSGVTTQQELYKFNGVFLALFQTSHVWGNLLSSLMLTAERVPTEDRAATALMGVYCGVYDICDEPVALISSYNDTTVTSASSTVLKLMGSYLVFAFTGFLLIIIFLEKLAGKEEEAERPCLQVAWTNLRLLFKHKVYRFLVPLLIFNGFEQGFVYSDYTKSYITCTLGIEFVGYNMITLGMTNSIFSVLIGHVARHVAREAIIGVGTILHLGLMVFLLVWIPDLNLLPVFFVISALWGCCDAIWQTQCNYLVSVSCLSEYETAFENFRMLQGFGASLAFFLSAFICVYAKLCILISLLILSIVFYVAAEYQIRRPDTGGAATAPAAADTASR